MSGKKCNQDANILTCVCVYVIYKLLLIPSWQNNTAGTCIYDSAAIMAGLFSNDNTFLRTPKSGDEQANVNNVEIRRQGSQEECPEEQQQDSSSNEVAVVFWEIFQIGLGLGLAIFLAIVPMVEIFELGWSSKTTCTDLLLLGLIWPAVGLVVYNVRVFIELDQYLKMKTDGPRRNKDFLRFIAWGLALLLLCFITFILSTLYIPVKDARLDFRQSQQGGEQMSSQLQISKKKSPILPTRSSDSLPGYCKWYVVML